MSTHEVTDVQLARHLKIAEMLADDPEKVMFGKLLTELSGLTEDRIKKAASQVPVSGLRELIYQFNAVIHERRGERMQELLEQMRNDGISADELMAYLEQKK